MITFTILNFSFFSIIHYRLLCPSQTQKYCEIHSQNIVILFFVTDTMTHLQTRHHCYVTFFSDVNRHCRYFCDVIQLLIIQMAYSGRITRTLKSVKESLLRRSPTWLVRIQIWIQAEIESEFKRYSDKTATSQLYLLEPLIAKLSRSNKDAKEELKEEKNIIFDILNAISLKLRRDPTNTNDDYKRRGQHQCTEF